MGPEWGPQSDNFTANLNGWILIEDNVNSEHEMMMSLPRRAGVMVFGGVLSAWIIAITLLLLVTLLRHRRVPLAGHVPSPALLVNLLLADLFTGASVVPFSAHTEITGSWDFGMIGCRLWLLARLALSSFTMWSVMMITLDHLVYAANPASYCQRMTVCKYYCLMFTPWVAGVLTCVPAAYYMMVDADFILTEVCAVAVDAGYAVGVSAAAFLIPAALALIVSTVLAILALCPRTHYIVHDANEADVTINQPCFPVETEQDTALDLPAYTVGNSATVGIALTACMVVMWTPFYVFSLAIPFCTTLCVDPSVWSLCEWLGYSASGVAPALLFLDLRVRQRFKQLIRCKPKKQSYHEKCSTEWKTDDALTVTEHLKPYAYVK